MAPAKRFLLRLDPRLFNALRRWADDDLRSVNAQIEYLLADRARRAGRLPARRAKPLSDGDSPNAAGSDADGEADPAGAGGTVNGGVTYGGTADVAPNFTVSGGLTHAAPPFSFDSEFVHLGELSASLADLTQTAGASVSLNPYSNALELTGTDSGLNVFTVSAT
jgi:hypothetical protein